PTQQRIHRTAPAGRVTAATGQGGTARRHDRTRRKDTMMRRIAIAATLAVTLLAAGCGDGDGSGDGTTKVRLGYLNTEAISPPLFVGLQKGIFERHGIDLELVKFDSGPAASQALAAGSVDVVDSGAA